MTEEHLDKILAAIRQARTDNYNLGFLSATTWIIFFAVIVLWTIRIMN